MKARTVGEHAFFKFPRARILYRSSASKIPATCDAAWCLIPDGIRVMSEPGTVVPSSKVPGPSGGHGAPASTMPLELARAGVHKRIMLFRAGGRRSVRVFGRGGDLYLDRSCGARGYLGAQASTCLVLHGEYHSLCRLHSMYFDPTVRVR